MSENPPKKAENPPPSITVEFDAAEDRDTLAKRLQQLAMHMQRSFNRGYDCRITVTQEMIDDVLVAAIVVRGAKINKETREARRTIRGNPKTLVRPTPKKP